MYLITTLSGNLYSVDNSSKLKLLEYTNKSIYTNDSSIRFVQKYNEDYILGTSEELLFYTLMYKPRVVSSFAMPGLIDIKDVVIDKNFAIILSGLRDSVYVFDGSFNQILACFNINKEGKLEFFKNRQVQCNEINSSYLQVFYCPGMNNYNKFDRLHLYQSQLGVYSTLTKKEMLIDLKSLNVVRTEMNKCINYGSFNHNIYVIGKALSDTNEIITDIIEC